MLTCETGLNLNASNTKCKSLFAASTNLSAAVQSALYTVCTQSFCGCVSDWCFHVQNRVNGMPTFWYGSVGGVFVVAAAPKLENNPKRNRKAIVDALFVVLIVAIFIFMFVLLGPSLFALFVLVIVVILVSVLPSSRVMARGMIVFLSFFTR